MMTAPFQDPKCQLPPLSRAINGRQPWLEALEARGWRWREEESRGLME